MAAVLEPQDATAKNTSRVDEQLAQATSRIRAHDLMFGGLVLVAFALVYTTAMILLDKYLNLPQWVRQVSLLGFVGTFAGVAYLTLLSPLRRKINPLYAARQVENTIDDAKNSVTGYVDAQQKGGLNATVKAALAKRAAQSVADADVNKAVDHRSLLWLGGIAIGLFLALIVLFFVFRPAQFGSLFGRTFAPFSSIEKVSQTQITLVKPEPAEPTITVGQSITVAVRVAGKVPSADKPDRVRLLVRHNPADPNYTELPMVQGNTTRDWELRVPDYLVQNGFWYKVVGGDHETPEHKVSVRSLPQFTDNFQATYVSPEYLRRAPETANSPIIKAYRGTTVTLLARTNRDIRDATMTIEPGSTEVTGTLVPGEPKAVQFVFKLKESGKYKLAFTATDGEATVTPLFQSAITVEADQEPRVVIDKPEGDESELPANGQLAIDGKVGDDFGIDTITLKMRIAGATARPLPDRPFLNGKSASFRREKDNTWPTDVEYKHSVDFSQLTKDAVGLPLKLEADTVIEYWLEATDNCTEPKPNVGRSAIKTVRLLPPKVVEEEKAMQDKQKDDRKNEEKKHNADQQQKLDQEKREPKNQPQPKDGKPDPKNPDKGGDKKDGNPDAKKGGEQPPKKGGEPEKKDDNTAGMPGMNDMGMNPPMPKTGTPDMNMNPMPMNPNDMGMPGMGTPETAPPPPTKDEKDIQRKADDLKNEIDKENKTGGSVKPNPPTEDNERAKPADAKPQPMGDMGNMAESKPEPKAGGDPMQKNDTKPADAKPEGNVEKPTDPAASKPQPPKAGEPMADPKADPKGAAPSEPRNEPVGSSPAQEKPQPKDAQPAPKDPNAKQDPNSGASAKPATDKKDGDPAGMPNATDKKDPAADAGSKPKPMPEATRGGDKPDQPKGAPPADTKPDQKPAAGEAKPDKAPPAADTKPKPADDMMPGGMTEAKPDGGANEPKPNGTGAADTKPAKPDDKNPPMGGGGGQGVEKGTEKPDPKDNPAKPMGGAGGNDPKQKKLDEKELKELEQAAKDLTNPDPKKKEAAQQKLDKAIGEDKRKELEKIANDLESPDKEKREAAQKKLDELKKQAQQGGDKGDKKEAPKFDEKQMKEIADAMKDLQSGDKAKQDAAREKLDKTIGEQQRKEAEQLMKDLQSPDKEKRDGAQKKLDDMKKELEKQTKGKKDGGDKGKELTKEEIADLAKKAQDLQSKDDKTREKAEKELDDKIGKENREKLQKEMKDKKPGDAEQQKKLKEELEKMAKDQQGKQEHDPSAKTGGGDGPKTKEAMEEDARNRLKSAELRLEEFERKKYDEAFQKKQGFTPAEYQKFLDGYEKHVEKLRDDVKKGVATGDKPPPATTAEPGTTITGGTGGKVAPSGPGTSVGTGGSKPVEAPGFEGARDKFHKLINEKK